MGKVTYVVEYEDGKEPPVHCRMNLAGGELVSVRRSDYRDSLLTSGMVESIRKVVAEGSKHTAQYDSIMRLIEGLEE